MLVDDDGQLLNDAMLVAIAGQVKEFQLQMEDAGITPGSVRALRLFNLTQSGLMLSIKKQAETFPVCLEPLQYLSKKRDTLLKKVQSVHVSLIYCAVSPFFALAERFLKDSKQVLRLSRLF